MGTISGNGLYGIFFNLIIALFQITFVVFSFSLLVLTVQYFFPKRKENKIAEIKRGVICLVLGIITSIAGLVFIYALKTAWGM